MPTAAPVLSGRAGAASGNGVVEPPDAPRPGAEDEADADEVEEGDAAGVVFAEARSALGDSAWKVSGYGFEQLALNSALGPGGAPQHDHRLVVWL